MKLWLILISLLMSCQALKNHELTKIKIEGRQPILRTDLRGLKIRSVEVKEYQGKPYLLRKAEDDKGNCVISRSEMAEYNLGQSVNYLLELGGKTETCVGQVCSHCDFKKDGGCECKDGKNVCTYTITKNRDIVKWF